MQVQLSNHSFRIFYGESFGDLLAAVVNGFGEYEINFAVEWFDEFAIVYAIEPNPKVIKNTWPNVLMEVFENII